MEPPLEQENEAKFDNRCQARGQVTLKGVDDFAWKMAKFLALTVVSGFDCLICAEFTQQRLSSTTATGQRTKCMGGVGFRDSSKVEGSGFRV